MSPPENTISTADSSAGEVDSRPLRTKALTASSWRFGVWATAKLVRLATNVVLAWLLTPAAFGIVALAESVMRGLNMFSEVGIGPAIVQNERDDDAFLNTAWTMQVIRGVVLALATLVIAGPIAIFYEEPALVAILPAIGVTALIAGFNSTSYFTLNRTLSEKHRAILDLVRAIVTRGTMIAFAMLVLANEWALVAGSLVGALFFTVFSHLYLPGVRNRFTWDKSAARALARFGVWVFIGTAIAFFGQQADRLMLGKLDTLSVLGVYGIALTVSYIPLELSSILIGTVLFPALSEAVRQQSGDLPGRVWRMRRPVLLAGMLAVVCVVVASPLFFELLYKPEYHDAAWIAPLTCSTTWILMLNDSANKVLLAMGRTRALAFSSLIRVICTIVFALVGYWLGATPTLALGGFILGTALGALSGHIANVVVLARSGVWLIRDDLLFTFAAGSLAGGAWAVDRAIATNLAASPTQISLRIAAGATIAGLLALFVIVRVRSEIRR